MSERTLLFKTVHGSRLYGLSHAGSDNDYYCVYTNAPKVRKRWAKQSVHEDEDIVRLDFTTWLAYCQNGVPQALEAMFSTMALYDDIGPFRESYRVGDAAVERYLRTIKNFCYGYTYKSKRHGLRLALNCHDLRRYGRFNPTLTDEEVDYISEVAHKDSDVVYAYAMNTALDDYRLRVL